MKDHLGIYSNWIEAAKRQAGLYLAASRAPSPLLVQYNRNDQLFTLQGLARALQKE
jgi:hypothetical protein